MFKACNLFILTGILYTKPTVLSSFQQNSRSMQPFGYYFVLYTKSTKQRSFHHIRLTKELTSKIQGHEKTTPTPNMFRHNVGYSSK